MPIAGVLVPSSTVSMVGDDFPFSMTRHSVYFLIVPLAVGIKERNWIAERGMRNTFAVVRKLDCKKTWADHSRYILAKSTILSSFVCAVSEAVCALI